MQILVYTCEFSLNTEKAKLGGLVMEFLGGGGGGGDRKVTEGVLTNRYLVLFSETV